MFVLNWNKINKSCFRLMCDETPIVLIHGAYHGGWAFSKVASLLRRDGFLHVSTPTLSGLGEQSSVANAGQIGLATHVQNIVKHLIMEDVRDAILVGHSYAGAIVSSVVAQQTGRIAHVVFLDAFVPLSEVMARERANDILYERLALEEQCVAPPPIETLAERWGLVDAEQRMWVARRLTPHPAKCFVEALSVANIVELDDDIRKTFIRCTRNPKTASIGNLIRDSYSEYFTYLELDAHHDVMIIEPQMLVDCLKSLVKTI